MISYHSLGLTLALLGSMASAQSLTIEKGQQPDVQPLAVHTGGRIDISGTTYTHQWPGIYLEAAFQGRSVTLSFDDPANEYRLLIDGLDPIPLAQPGTTSIRISGLTDSPHQLRLEKVTESVSETGSFGGFTIDAGGQPGTVLPRQRQIEFIGDSDMTGYGIHAPGRDCTPDQVRLLSDTQVAYPALVGKHFDADYQINAISGRGMVRNYDGFDPGVALPLVYPYSLPATGAAYADPAWQPQIIYIALGGNDFATPLHGGESWANTTALIDDFTASFGRFISMLHTQHPQASLLIAMPYGAVIPEVRTPAFTAAFQSALLTTAGDIGLDHIDFLTLTDSKPEFTACDYHPSLRDQQNRAAWLIGYLDEHPGLWDRP
jgi:Carbohydrate esterase 2 N-terminal/GDSL-like Lipase/Acylhydrolase family